jgi:hypothetical protein
MLKVLKEMWRSWSWYPQHHPAFAWMRAIWTWLTTSRCYTCHKVVRRSQLCEYPWLSGKVCGSCWQNMRKRDREDEEQAALDSAVREERLRQRARQIVERENTYRESGE